MSRLPKRDLNHTEAGPLLSPGEMQVDLSLLAGQRINQFMGEAIRYWQYIGQSGLALSVIILFLLGLIYYDQLLAGIPDWWPLGITYAIIFTWLCFRTPQRHFIEEADLIFLTPREREMTNYFNKTCLYNLTVQMAGLVVVLILLYPVYRDLVQGVSQPGWAYFLLPIVLKGWNYYTHWSTLKMVEGNIRYTYHLLRLGYTFGLLLWWFEKGPWWFIIGFGLAGIAFLMFDWYLTRDRHYPWLALLELEKRQRSRFYSFCQAFVDVPHSQPQVKRRAWLAPLVSRLPFKQETAIRYLYLKTWLRSRDHFGLFVRLTVLGSLGIYLLEDVWGQGLLYVLILFTTGIQLRGIKSEHQHHLWFQLFPVQDRLRKQSVQWLVRRLLTIQSVLLAAALWVSAGSASLTFLICLAALVAIHLVYSR